MGHGEVDRNGARVQGDKRQGGNQRAVLHHGHADTDGNVHQGDEEPLEHRMRAALASGRDNERGQVEAQKGALDEQPVDRAEDSVQPGEAGQIVRRGDVQPEADALQPRFRQHRKPHLQCLPLCFRLILLVFGFMTLMVFFFLSLDIRWVLFLSGFILGFVFVIVFSNLF